MKAYLFNVETGLYQGETFEEADMLHNEEGITSIPPPDYEHGQVPVFDRRKNGWAVIPVTIAKQLLHLNDQAGSIRTSHPSPPYCRCHVLPRRAAYLKKAVTQAAEGRQLGFLGEPRVNVLELNVKLDILK